MPQGIPVPTEFLKGFTLVFPDFRDFRIQLYGPIKGTERLFMPSQFHQAFAFAAPGRKALRIQVCGFS
jgi:hypothetical protein